MILDLCPSPALYPYYQKENDTVIVVDVFRASATICAMLHNGAAAVIPVPDIEQAKHYKAAGFLVGAERKTRKCDFADFGNSPFDYKPEIVAGKEVVFTTTNGTMAIEMGQESKHLFIGTFSNIDALADKCMESSERIVVLCAGWNNRVNVEDTLFGGAFAERLSEKADITLGSDAVRIALTLWQQAKSDPLAYLRQSDHHQRLIDNGAEGDAAFCLRENTTTVVPGYLKEEKKLRRQ
ncbi:2-phosphosulfolactate phosphatase [Proteiniphilum sp. UBA1028]|jgi:2-phosphosulfolactate phosphatase|uniref:2-phosphosulfolactate phosphatase n=1 Tax=Proteiniphilum sp. UBA1028 TaxID=1947251 RepID=UPI000E7EB905|nr:2-phosphosulfolactate phosphatase [Proteiniphilum sp. UBA1028]HBG56816.1 2-phosphosulfolactate phosphatase [Porphyromonadaceae bacterium]